ncbi:MAG TPA: CHAD domain-containing protein [Draconibacterium sp.]|nr:CHAD domain-containing protein [Draconibacterium sp.]
MPHNAGKRLVEAIKKQLERIEYFSSAANVSPNLAVHEMRKSFKRLRALLLFYDEYPEEFPQEFCIQIKNYGRLLSVLRESYVNIQIFERLAAGNNLIAERKLKAGKEKLQAKNREIIDNNLFGSEGFENLYRFTVGLEQQVVRMEIDKPSQIQLAKQLVISYQKSFDCYLLIGNNTDGEEIHNLRKKLKRLWYQFDLIQYLHPRFFRLKSDQLNKITEQLGEDHDLFVFLNDLKLDNLGFEALEIEIIENQVEHLREINLLKLYPRLKQFFNDPPSFFTQKMEQFFKVSFMFPYQ